MQRFFLQEVQLGEELLATGRPLEYPQLNDGQVLTCNLILKPPHSSECLEP